MALMGKDNGEPHQAGSPEQQKESGLPPARAPGPLQGRAPHLLFKQVLRTGTRTKGSQHQLVEEAGGKVGM